MHGDGALPSAQALWRPLTKGTRSEPSTMARKRLAVAYIALHGFLAALWNRFDVGTCRISHRGVC